MRHFPLLLLTAAIAHAEPLQFSGIYPHLAMFNNEGECGTGAVVSWADRLWVITYGPHLPKGSSDKLYEIDTALNQTIRPESVGGTPANRMIHRESNQLFIGPYAIDANRKVRVITPEQMYGRHTGNARHLTDPANKIYYATMEEGIYEVDVHTLAVTELWADEQKKTGRHSNLPGYHGKGLYSGQGRLIYANNGDHAREALKDPTVPSGVLAEWDGKSDAWIVVRRNQFTDVTGPGGIEGNANPATDPIWSIGWDHRSLILHLLDGGKWHSFRLPKASHSYDGAHGWNTEWPRIRDVGEEWKLMTMHGMFWKFPRTFSAANTAGIAPLSTYLKVVGDFARWGDRIVFGCDDTARSEFLNKRKVKGTLAGPGQSQSNLWFLRPEQLRELGPVAASGSLWVRDEIRANEPSEPFLFAGFDRRSLHLGHESAGDVTFTLEVNDGRGEWKELRKITLPAGGYRWEKFAKEEVGAWIRLRTSADAKAVTASFHYAVTDSRTEKAADLFNGLADARANDYSGGVLLTRGNNQRTLDFAATVVRDGKAAEPVHYQLTADMKLVRENSGAEALSTLVSKAAVPREVITEDAASVLMVDDAGRRWRLPRHDAYPADGALPLRVCREVCTERDLLQVHGTFYELPAENAGGFIKMRPVATHLRRITDYCSYRGLLVLAGITPDATGEHIVRSEDGSAALWLGTVDDLWKLGKPRGEGGPWFKSSLEAGQVSDPYLIAGYDRKSLTVSHTSPKPLEIIVEVDFLGDNTWREYAKLSVPTGAGLKHEFADGYSARWVRLRADGEASAVTATFHYE